MDEAFAQSDCNVLHLREELAEYWPPNVTKRGHPRMGGLACWFHLEPELSDGMTAQTALRDHAVLCCAGRHMEPATVENTSMRK